jgi:hypothetical protein
VNRCDEPGYRRIGVLCTDEVRSLWVRWPEGGAIELCAGRHGNDDHVRILPDDPLHRALADLFGAAEFAATCPVCGALPHGEECPDDYIRDRCETCGATRPS